MLQINKILFKKIKFPLSSRSDRSNLDHSGFSLIELMVAIAILAIAAVGIFQAYSVGFQSMSDAKDRTVATNIAQRKVEEIKNSVKVAYPYFTEETQELNGREFTVRVVAEDYSEEEGEEGDLNLKLIYVTVVWRNRKNEVKDVQLQTLVYDLETIIVENPDVGRIVLSANPTEVTCCVTDEISTITAELFNTSTPEENVTSGIPVSFSVVSGDGSVDPEFDVTDASGKAYTDLTVNNLGPATVKATSGLVDSDPLEVTCIPAANEITLSANPSAILPGDKSVISATVTDTCGNVISEEVTVEFTTDDSDSYFLVEGVQLSTTTVTTVDGVATVDLYITVSGKTATVTGTVVPVPTEGEAISGSTTVLCTDYSISVSADPTTINPGGSNDSSTITATLTTSGTETVEGQSISFTTDKGILSSSSALTNSSGQAVVTLSSLSGGDIATVTATYIISGEDSISGTTSVRCAEYVLSITADPDKVIPGSPSNITATLKDYEGNLIAGRSIEFYTTEGILADASVYTNSSGIAPNTLILDQVGDTATVTASIGFASKSVDVQCIEFILIAIPDPESISPGGVSEITATLTNYLHAAQSGRTITFTTDEGTFTETGTAVATDDTDWRGEAVVHLTLSNPGDNAIVTATYEMVEYTVEVSCFDTYITLNNPPNIDVYGSGGSRNEYVRFDLYLHGGPLTVDKLRINWETDRQGRPSRYEEVSIQQPLWGGYPIEVYDNTGWGSHANKDTIETLDRTYTLSANSSFRVVVHFIYAINDNYITFTFNPDDPGAEENYQVEFSTPN